LYNFFVLIIQVNVCILKMYILENTHSNLSYEFIDPNANRTYDQVQVRPTLGGLAAMTTWTRQHLLADQQSSSRCGHIEGMPAGREGRT